MSELERKPYKLGSTTGTIDSEKIVSRHEINQVLKLLENQSVRVEEIRRMGKTMLVQKLEYRTQNEEIGNKAIYFMLQGVKGLDDLTDKLLDQLIKHSDKPWLKTSFRRIGKLYQSIIPKDKVEIGDVKFSLPEFKGRWKDTLEATLGDIADRSNERNEVFTLILDELPLMLWEWIQSGKAKNAIELLDHLRNLRFKFKEEGRIRYLICGSVGMNVVLSQLREKHNYTGEPFNDCEIFSLGNMSKEDASFLCECLALDDFELIDDKDACFDLILHESSQLPFFIHKAFSFLNLKCDSKISVENTKKAFKDILENSQNSAFEIFDQLTNRLKIYYPVREDKALDILEAICVAGKILESDLLNQLDIQKRELIEILELLQKEQYIVREIIEGERQYSFKYEIIKKWWRINKV